MKSVASFAQQLLLRREVFPPRNAGGEDQLVTALLTLKIDGKI